MMPNSSNNELEETNLRCAIEFAAWSTDVDNDELWLADLDFRSTHFIGNQEADLLLSLPNRPKADTPDLRARFFSIEKRSLVCFEFTKVEAFRVQHEGGFIELWEATAKNGRPTLSTFRVRGHGWQKESFLNWFHSEPFSYVVATLGDCLEVVTTVPPLISFENAEVSTLSTSPYAL